MTETPKEYSRESISGAEKRQKTAKEIRDEKGSDKRDTAEGKKELSESWIKKANLSPEQIKKVKEKLGIKDSMPAEEQAKVVTEWQKKNGLEDTRNPKNNGIIGWQTLEKLDTMIEEEDKKYDRDNQKDWNKEGYGLSRVAYHEKTSDQEKPPSADPASIMEKHYTDMETWNYQNELINPYWEWFLEPVYSWDKFVWFKDAQWDLYNRETGKFEAKRNDNVADGILESIRSTPIQTILGNTEIKKWIDGATNLEALRANKNLQGMKLTEENGVIVVENNDERVYLTRNKENTGWNVSNKSPSEEAKEKYEADQKSLWEMLQPNLDWRSGAGSSYRDLKIWEFESKKDKFYGDGGDGGTEKVLPSGERVYLGHVTTQAYLENMIKEMPEETLKLLSEKWVTFGEYLGMKENPISAAEKLAGTDKPARLPAWLGEDGMLYQKSNNWIVLKTNEKGSPRSIIENWREQNIVTYAMKSPNASIDLPNGARIVRVVEWDKQVLQYFAKKDADKSSFTYKWGEWRKTA